jgi:hypothetical protein
LKRREDKEEEVSSCCFTLKKEKILEYEKLALSGELAFEKALDLS